MVSFANTSMKTGKRLLSLASFSQEDMFSRQYLLTSKSEKNDMGQYFILDIRPAGKVEDANTFKFAENMWEKYHEKREIIEVHSDDTENQQDGDSEKAPF